MFFSFPVAHLGVGLKNKKSQKEEKPEGQTDTIDTVLFAKLVSPNLFEIIRIGV